MQAFVIVWLLVLKRLHTTVLIDSWFALFTLPFIFLLRLSPRHDVDSFITSLPHHHDLACSAISHTSGSSGEGRVRPKRPGLPDFFDFGFSLQRRRCSLFTKLRALIGKGLSLHIRFALRLEHHSSSRLCRTAVQSGKPQQRISITTNYCAPSPSDPDQNRPTKSPA